MIFSGQGHSVSATDFYPQPSGWGRRFVQGSPPAGPNRPPHKASGHLESKTGQVWWVLYGNLRERLPPKSNISPPSMSQSCGGAEGTGNRRNPAVSPKIFRLNPLNFVRIPPGLCSVTEVILLGNRSFLRFLLVDPKSESGSLYRQLWFAQ